MKTTNEQLDDAMICRLVDAHGEGVAFSDAIDLARIPEHLAPEAKEFWTTLDGTALFSAAILPRADIIDRVLAADAVSVRERAPQVLLRPSPYMRYIMAFSVPVAIAVFIFGVSLRRESEWNETTNPLAKTTGQSIIEGGDSGATNSVTARASSAPLAKAVSAPAPSRSALATSRALSSSPKVSTAEKVAAAKKDPKRLFAMLTNAGAKETQSDAVIDDNYDAQISDLSDKVTNSDNPQFDVPLR